MEYVSNAVIAKDYKTTSSLHIHIVSYFLALLMELICQVSEEDMILGGILNLFINFCSYLFLLHHLILHEKFKQKSYRTRFYPLCGVLILMKNIRKDILYFHPTGAQERCNKMRCIGYHKSSQAVSTFMIHWVRRKEVETDMT